MTQHKRTIHGLNAQSHIRRVEKFITPTAQQKQVMMHQQELQLDALKLKHSNLHNQKQELESNLELKDAEAESEVIKLEKEMFEIENQVSLVNCANSYRTTIKLYHSLDVSNTKTAR